MVKLALKGIDMQQEVYTAIKMFRALEKACITAYNSNSFGAGIYLWNQYNKIRVMLERPLGAKIEYIPNIESDRYNRIDDSVLIKLMSCCSISIAFLDSLGTDQTKELLKMEKLLSDKENRLNLREKELFIKESEVEGLRKTFSESINTLKQIQEAVRSGEVAKWKEYHRDIELHENPKKKE